MTVHNCLSAWVLLTGSLLGQPVAQLALSTNGLASLVCEPDVVRLDSGNWAVALDVQGAGSEPRQLQFRVEVHGQGPDPVSRTPVAGKVFIERAKSRKPVWRVARVETNSAPQASAVSKVLAFLCTHPELALPPQGTLEATPRGYLPFATDWRKGSRQVIQPVEVLRVAPVKGQQAAVDVGMRCLLWDLTVLRTRRGVTAQVNQKLLEFSAQFRFEGRKLKVELIVDGARLAETMFKKLGERIEKLVLEAGLRRPWVRADRTGTRSYLVVGSGRSPDVAALVDAHPEADRDVVILLGADYLTWAVHRHAPTAAMANIRALCMPVAYDAEGGAITLEHDAPEDDSPRDLEVATAPAELIREFRRSSGLRVVFDPESQILRLRGQILVLLGNRLLAWVKDIDWPFAWRARGNRPGFVLQEDLDRLEGGCSEGIKVHALSGELKGKRLKLRVARVLDALYGVVGLVAQANPVPFLDEIFPGTLRIGAYRRPFRLVKGGGKLVAAGKSTGLLLHADLEVER